MVTSPPRVKGSSFPALSGTAAYTQCCLAGSGHGIRDATLKQKARNEKPLVFLKTEFLPPKLTGERMVISLAKSPVGNAKSHTLTLHFKTC